MLRKDQIVRRLREAGFTHARQCDRVDFWRKPGTTLIVNIPRRDLLTEAQCITLLSQAGLSRPQIEDFLRVAVKEPVK